LSQRFDHSEALSFAVPSFGGVVFAVRSFGDVAFAVQSFGGVIIWGSIIPRRCLCGSIMAEALALQFNVAV
jgi:hypothetical protein